MPVVVENRMIQEENSSSRIRNHSPMEVEAEGESEEIRKKVKKAGREAKKEGKKNFGSQKKSSLAEEVQLPNHVSHQI